jgi:hypothetical protein
MRRALANRLGLPLGLEVQGILCYGKMGLFLIILVAISFVHVAAFFFVSFSGDMNDVWLKDDVILA